jgi:hypothetical protein
MVLILYHAIKKKSDKNFKNKCKYDLRFKVHALSSYVLQAQARIFLEFPAMQNYCFFQVIAVVVVSLLQKSQPMILR